MFIHYSGLTVGISNCSLTNRVFITPVHHSPCKQTIRLKTDFAMSNLLWLIINLSQLCKQYADN